MDRPAGAARGRVNRVGDVDLAEAEDRMLSLGLGAILRALRGLQGGFVHVGGDTAAWFKANAEGGGTHQERNCCQEAAVAGSNLAVGRSKHALEIGSCGGALCTEIQITQETQ